ncbi:MAG: hypothetical protein ACI87W_003480 [Halieaceae bacterium]|jgi:hypothetical protein
MTLVTSRSPESTKGKQPMNYHSKIPTLRQCQQRAGQRYGAGPAIQYALSRAGLIRRALFAGGGACRCTEGRGAREAYEVLNLRATISGEKWRLTTFANNALDEGFLAEVIPAPEFGGSFFSPGARAR